jgi:hypothetical protein
MIMAEISKYWENAGVTQKKEGKVFGSSVGYMCAECCNKDRETDCDCYYRPNCPYCLGTAQNLTSERMNADVNNQSKTSI